MPCYHPMVLVNTSDMTDPEQIKIVERLRLVHKHDKKVKSVNTILIPRELAQKEGLRLKENNALIVPCGQCIGCRLDYSRLWAERCVHEASLHKSNYFLTLTYDDYHLPIGSKGLPTLVKDEVSAFMKRFRDAMFRKYGVRDIRFFACGEYGDGVAESGYIKRPHYHIILFNCPIQDFSYLHPCVVDGKKKLIKMYSEDGEMLLFSKVVSDCWQKGNCPIGQVSFESCAYVSRYIVKKQKGQGARVYGDCGIIPEFVRMSRNPGIGFDWYMTNLDKIYKHDNISLRRGDKVVNSKPGRYCDNLLKLKDEGQFYNLKKKRHEDFYSSLTCKEYEDVDLIVNLHRSEEIKDSQIKILKRSLC